MTAHAVAFLGDDVEAMPRAPRRREGAAGPPNFLVLDAPANHLDIATKEMLIVALSRYEGTMLLPSRN